MNPPVPQDLGRLRRWTGVCGNEYGNERGNVLLIILLFLVATGVLTVGLLSSLLGEIQGGFSYRHGVKALAVAEAGIHYAVARINETGGTYTGESGRQMVHPGPPPVVLGVFDVAVRCSDGTTVPGNPNPCAVAPRPNERIITATGFVPDSTRSLGRRTVVIVVRQAMLTSLDFAVCGRDGVTLDRDTDLHGNTGSNQNIELRGPPNTPGSLARTHAWGGQPGNATAAAPSPARAPAGRCTTRWPG